MDLRKARKRWSCHTLSWQDLAATLRVLEDLASAADAAAETWPVGISV